MEAIRRRHSVRQYKDEPLTAEEIATLSAAIDAVNERGRLHVQLVLNEPEAFRGGMVKYGKFENANNYLVMVGDKNSKGCVGQPGTKAGVVDGIGLDERCGYYGEQLVLLAQQIGLNTCWVGMKTKKVPGAYQLAAGEKVVLVIAIGHGRNRGVPHKGKSAAEVGGLSAESTSARGAEGGSGMGSGAEPDWYLAGLEAAALAPTAMNQQKFRFSREGDAVSLTSKWGPFSKVDMGIVRCHFEIGAGVENFRWK